MPFADPDRAIVTTSRFVRAVQFSTGRVRILDQMGAMLENCQMEPGGHALGCALDLSFSPARFDMDGVELTDNFQPASAR